MYRTHTCNELDKKHIGKEAVLSGWVRSRRDHGGLIFVDLRDRYGITQIVTDPSHDKTAHAVLDSVRPEFVLKVKGNVRARPAGSENVKLATGDIEILCHEVEILNESKTPPFEIDRDGDVNEELRLKYRYLDLRRDRLKSNIEMRHRLIKFIRDFLDKKEFLEIETPILIKGTPEGSREYMVPSRLHPGKFYVLPQSPQQLKQLCMVAGLDRYFQIARCFRDEDTRGDRQPEFTQLDLEMSFVDEKDVMDVNEELMIALCEALVPEKKILAKPFPRITWQEAMDRFGSDKPDMRFSMELQDATEFFKQSGFKVFADAIKTGGVIKMLRVPGGAKFSRSKIDELTELAKVYGAKGLAYIICDEILKSPILKFFSEKEIAVFKKESGIEDGDIVFFTADEFRTACTSLGHVRLACGNEFKLRDPNVFAFLWVIDFPMFEWSKEENCISAAHHPFCSIKMEDLPLLEKEPLKAHAKAYDFVLNGVEVGGGSIRIHKPEVQAKIFDILGITKEDAGRRFGHMLEAFTYGAPPHGGIAWGLDRLVMIFCDEPNIREVIAFPKDQRARDLMLDAPSELPAAQIAEMHIKPLSRLSPMDLLKNLLSENHVFFEMIHHTPVKTSAEAAKVRGSKLSQGARALVFETEKGLIMAVTPANREVDEIKLKEISGAKKLKLAQEDTLRSKTELSKGAVPPLGILFDMPTFVDAHLFEEEWIYFNAGSHINSIKMKSSDYKKVFDGREVEIT